MNLCSRHHEEICYEGTNCPVCELQNQVDKLEEKVKNLESQIEDLEYQE